MSYRVSQSKGIPGNWLQLSLLLSVLHQQSFEAPQLSRRAALKVHHFTADNVALDRETFRMNLEEARRCILQL